MTRIVLLGASFTNKGAEAMAVTAISGRMAFLYMVGSCELVPCVEVDNASRHLSRF